MSIPIRIPSQPLKAGFVGGSYLGMDFAIGASEVFVDNGGHWVKPDGSGRVELAGATSVNIIGWAEQKARTASSTEARDNCTVNLAFDALYTMPACVNGAAATEAQLQAALGESCDIYVASNVQYADVATASSYDVLLIVGYGYFTSSLGGQWVIVQRVPLAFNPTDVA